MLGVLTWQLQVASQHVHHTMAESLLCTCILQRSCSFDSLPRLSSINFTIQDGQERDGGLTLHGLHMAPATPGSRLKCASVQGFSSDMGGKRDEAAQICASILVKLVMDMVLKAGTAVALPLALVLLHR